MSFLIRKLLLLTVFLIPLIGAFINFDYEQSKVLFFMVLTSLSGFVWLIHLMKNPKFEQTFRGWIMVGFLISTVADEDHFPLRYCSIFTKYSS